MAKDIKSPAALGRIAIVLLGIVIMGVGLHSHFQSSWTKADSSAREFICQTTATVADKPCPKISMEQFYVSIVIITFIISLIGLAAFFFMDLEKFKMIDMGYHVVAAVLLLIAAIVYIMSAEQIKGQFSIPGIHFEPKSLRRGEKLAAAALTIIHALLHGVVALLIARQ